MAIVFHDAIMMGFLKWFFGCSVFFLVSYVCHGFFSWLLPNKDVIQGHNLPDAVRVM